MTNNKIMKSSLLALVLFSCSGLAVAGNSLPLEQNNPHKPVATILPEAGLLTREDGELNQGLALECVKGRPGGISYFNPENNFDVAINAPLDIEVTVDNHKPVRFTSTRIFNEKAPEALTTKSDDAESAVRIIHVLETSRNEVQVKVSNVEKNITKTFKLNASDMKGAVESFRTYCELS